VTAAAPARIPGVPDRIVSIAEASRLTGLPKAAIRGRVDRGELRAIRRGGLRRISVDELAERGLLEGTGSNGATDDGDVSATVELLDRLERQSEEIGRLRMELAIAQRRADTEQRRRERRERRR
jgi:excisionase family DNA binding protein